MTGTQKEIKNKEYYLRKLEEAWKKEMLYNQRSAEASAETQRSDISWSKEKEILLKEAELKIKEEE